MESLFSKFMRLREEKEEPVSGVTSHVKLQKKQGNHEFTPFEIGKSSHPNLAKVVKAFVNSDKVGLGYTTLDKNKGEVEPQMKKKTIYLAGGSVRDHLIGKTPKNYNLVTDATPSETRMILKHAGFKEVKPQSEKNRYEKLPNDTEKSKIFYASRWDKRGKEMEVVAVVNGQPFQIATLSKSPKSKNFTPDDSKMASSIEEDASNRDFTINAMYIPLTNFSGPNSDLIDPFGGANHLKSGEIKSVGEKFDDRLKEDPLTGFRLVNHFNRFGKGDNIPDNYMKSMRKDNVFDNADSKGMKDEFVNGLENPDIDTKKFLKTYHQSGLLNLLFPNINFEDHDVPNDMRSDRWMVAAWILRNNSPHDVRDMLLSGGWNKQEANDVAYLVKMYQWGKAKFDPDKVYDMIQSHTALTKSKVHDWMNAVNMDGQEVNQFMNMNCDDLQPYKADMGGMSTVNPIYIKFSGHTPSNNEIEDSRKSMISNRWKNLTGRML